MPEQKHKYAFQAYLINTTVPHVEETCRVGDLFTCAATAHRAARATDGWQHGRFNHVAVSRVRVSLRLWQTLNAQEIA